MAVRVEPRHLVLVLVGEQLGVVDRDRARQRLAIAALLGGLADLIDQLAIALGKTPALVGGQVPAAMLDDLVERHRLQRFWCDDLVRPLQHAGEARRIGDRQAAEAEGLLVHLDRDAVDLDRLLDRLRRQRQQPLLIGIAHHHHVGGDAVAEQRLGRLGEVEEGRVLAQRGLQQARSPCGSGS
jgi:hypothetical protein